MLMAGPAMGQAPKEAPAEPILPQRSIQLTAEQGHTIKEIVLKDMNVAPAGAKAEAVKIGEKIPQGVNPQPFPESVTERVPQVRTYKFFLLDRQVVVVGPQNTVADILK
jgi:hypothetical protein